MNLDVFTATERKLYERNNRYAARSMCIQRLRDSGYSLREIAEAMDLSHEWVRQLLIRNAASA